MRALISETLRSSVRYVWSAQSIPANSISQRQSSAQAQILIDWFERITGFKEDGYDATRARLSIVDGHLRSWNSLRTCAVGQLETPTLAELRQRAVGLISGHGPTRVSYVQGDVRRMHAELGNAGALFQVGVHGVH